MDVLLVEDMEQSRELVTKLVLYLLRISHIVPKKIVIPKTRQELQDIAKSKIKFDLILLDGCLRHWGGEISYKNVLEDIFRALRWHGVVIGISTSQVLMEEMEGVLRKKADCDGRSSFRFMSGGKSLDALSGPLKEALAISRKKYGGGSMPKIKLIEIHVGSLRCCKNCGPIGEKVVDLNVGPDYVKVKDPTKPARCYALGDPVREVIGEAYEYLPGQPGQSDPRWKEQDAVLDLGSREERKAWLDHDYDLLRENVMA